MTHELNALQNIKNFEEEIYFANGSKIKSKFMGDYVGYINVNKIILHDVLYIPKFKRNLLSIDHICNENFKIVFYKHKFKNNVNCVTIYSPNNKRICTTYSNNSNTFKVYFTKNKINYNNNFNNNICLSLDKSIKDMDLWHRRLWHFNIDILKNKLKKY